MINRKKIKAYGKQAFKANYWKSVLVAFLATIATGTASSAGSRNGFQNSFNNNNGTFMMDNETAMLVTGVVVVGVIIGLIVGIGVKIFLLNPLTVGCNSFFLANRVNHNTQLNHLERGFKINYKNLCKALFMRDLYIFLWTLLFIVPGIIKSFDYYLVSYLLTEDPNMNYETALETSRKLMYGKRWETFVFDLSFIGWYILSAITLGIVGLFYTQPFIEASKAQLYVELVHPEYADLVDTGLPARNEQIVQYPAQQ